MTCLEDDRFFVEPDVQELRQAVLHEALGLFQAFIDQHGTDPVVRYQTGRAYRRIAMIQTKLGRFGQSERASEQAIRVLRQLVAESPSERKYRAVLADSCRELGGMLFFHAGRLSAAEQPFRDAAGLYAQLIADGSEDRDDRSEWAHCCRGRIIRHSGLVFVMESREARRGGESSSCIACRSRSVGG